MPVAGAVATLVVLLVEGPSELGKVTWHALLIVLALAALHPVLTFSLEYLSLRGLTAKAFGTLMSLEPAIALLAGLLVLGRMPDTASAIGVIFVVIAGIGAVRTGARAPAPGSLGPDPPARRRVAALFSLPHDGDSRAATSGLAPFGRAGAPGCGRVAARSAASRSWSPSSRAWKGLSAWRSCGQTLRTSSNCRFRDRRDRVRPGARRTRVVGLDLVQPGQRLPGRQVPGQGLVGQHVSVAEPVPDGGPQMLALGGRVPRRVRHQPPQRRPPCGP